MGNKEKLEKAKVNMDYKEKLEKAMELYPTANADQRYVLECLFPELAENRDERIRKALIKFHKSTIDIDGIKGEQIVAWLEKQGESYTKRDVDNAFVEGMALAKDELEKQGNKKKPADKVKPKFKVGDWIVSNEKLYVYQIKEINDFVVKVREINGETFVVNVNCLKDAHLWTIQDAEDGDVLACGDKITDCPFIFHNLTEELNPRSYCGINKLLHFQDNDENGGFWCQSYEVRPATKEQRDLLFKKMKEEGYEWDADKKELKEPQRMISAEAKEALYDKPATIDIDKMVDDYANNEEFGKPLNCMIRAYRQGLKDAIGKVVSESDWSEEDEEMLDGIILRCEKYGHQEQINWLKSLKQRIGG